MKSGTDGKRGRGGEERFFRLPEPFPPHAVWYEKSVLAIEFDNWPKGPVHSTLCLFVYCLVHSEPDA